MPVLDVYNHERLTLELKLRTDELMRVFERRPLKYPSEGCKNGTWINQDNICATKGSASEIRIALSDFKTILDEIGRLK